MRTYQPSELIDAVDLSHSAVLVVDFQNDFAHSEGAGGQRRDVSRIQAAVERFEPFMEEARSLGIPFIHIRTHNADGTEPSNRPRGWGGGDGERVRSLVPGSWGADFYYSGPMPGEPIVTKHRFSAFIGTDLDMILRSMGIRTAVMTGCGTPVCVESTARDAKQHDYYVVALEDCVETSFTYEDHLAALNALDKVVGVVTNSQTILTAWAEMPKSIIASRAVR